MARTTTEPGVRYQQRGASYRTGVRVDLYVFECASCGLLFGITDDFDDRRRADGAAFYCPNGHYLSYRESVKSERQKREAAEQELRLARNQRDSAREEAEHQRHVAAGHKAYATKIQNRIKNGVCPWCNRSGFERIARHIASKHPAMFAEHLA